MRKLKTLDSYACYYGTGHLEELQRYSLIILQAGNYGRGEIQNLQASGSLVLGYLSLGEDQVSSGNAEWYLRDKRGGLYVNRDWDTCYVDTRKTAWHRNLLESRVPRILNEARCDGLLLDTLDAQDLFPETRSGTVALVHAIRAAFPSAILFANRGFTILERIAADLDGVMFECFSTRYEAGRYRIWNSPDLELNGLRAEWLERLRLVHPLVLLSLDYASPGQVELVEFAVRRARAYGLVPYVGTRALDELYYLPPQDQSYTAAGTRCA